MRADHVSNCVRVERIPAHCDAIARLNCAAYSNRLHSACDRRSFVPAVSRAIIESNADCHARAHCDSLHFRPVPTYGARASWSRREYGEFGIILKRIWEWVDTERLYRSLWWAAIVMNMSKWSSTVPFNSLPRHMVYALYILYSFYFLFHCD